MSNPSLPRISVAVPTCERPHDLQNALQSLARQTCADFQVIVVNNGATDVGWVLQASGLGAVVRDLQLLRTPGFQGSSAARNAGLHANGGWRCDCLSRR